MLGVIAREAAGQCCDPHLHALRAAPSEALAHEYTSALRSDGRGGVQHLWYELPTAGPSSGWWIESSLDEGDTWLPPLPLGCHASAPLPGLAVTPEGQVLVAYIDGGALHVMTSADQGRTFLAPVVLASDPAPHAFSRPRAAMSPAGVAVVTWIVNSRWIEPNGPQSGGDGLWAAMSTDYGVTWSTPERVDARTPGVVLYDTLLESLSAAASDAAVVIAWWQVVPLQNASIWSVRRGAGDPAWSAASQVVELSPNSPWVPQLGTTEPQVFQLFYAYLEGGSETLRVRVSEDGGATWGAESVVATPADSYASALLCRPDGRVYLAWEDQRPSTMFWVQVSTDHGRPGTWLPAARNVPSVLERAGYQSFALGPADTIAIAVSDQRPISGCDGCRHMWLITSCDDGLTWTEHRVESGDGVTVPAAVYSILDVSSGQRAHVGYTRHLVGVPPLPPHERVVASVQLGPDVRLEEPTPWTACQAGTLRLVAEPGPLGACATPAYQWSRDGSALPGETGSSLVILPDTPSGPHRYEYTLTCTEPLPCANVAAARTVDVPGGESGVIGATTSNILVSRSLSGLHLDWTDIGVASTGYNVYYGHIGTWYDLAPLACHVARQPADAVLLSADVPDPAPDIYIVVVPADCLGEGSWGESSTCSPSPAVASPCGPMP